MKTDNNLAAKSGEARETRAEKAIRLLTTAAGNPFQQKLEEFKPFYPAVIAAKSNGMKNKQIIKILSEGGLKLYPVLFEKLMTALDSERDVSTCPKCGQTLSASMSTTEAGEAPTDSEGPLADTSVPHSEGTSDV